MLVRNLLYDLIRIVDHHFPDRDGAVAARSDEKIRIGSPGKVPNPVPMRGVGMSAALPGLCTPEVDVGRAPDASFSASRHELSVWRRRDAPKWSRR